MTALLFKRRLFPGSLRASAADKSLPCENQKGMGARRRQEQLSWIVVECSYDALWRFMALYDVLMSNEESDNNCHKTSQIWRTKTDKEKSHKGIWWWEIPRERPGDKFGTSQGHPGRLGRFMWKFTFKGQNVRGRWRDRWDMSTGQTGHKPGGVPPKFFMFIGFSFPSKALQDETKMYT